MNWKTAFRSIYCDGSSEAATQQSSRTTPAEIDAPEPADLDLPPRETALLVIDVQNAMMKPGRLQETGARAEIVNEATTGLK